MLNYSSAVFLIAILFRALAPLAAQDTLITVANDTLLVLMESRNDETLRYRSFDDEQGRLREARLQQIRAILYQDKQDNSDYYAQPAERFAEVEDTSRLFIVKTIDGNTYVGKVLSREGGKVQLETQTVGVINIPNGNIKEIEMVASSSSFKGGELWQTNPLASRYFITPSGYGLRAGEGYYQNNLIFFNQVNVGVTDNISLGLGAIPLFLFGGTPTPVWINPKISVPVAKDQLNLGGSALIGTVLGDGAGGFGFLIGTATIGNRDRNASFGLGYGYAGGEFAQTPVITLSGTYRIGQKGYLVTDNFFVSTGGFTSGIIMLGGRTVWPSISLDYGGLIPLGDVGTIFVFPWLGVSVPFGS